MNWKTLLFDETSEQPKNTTSTQATSGEVIHGIPAPVTQVSANKQSPTPTTTITVQADDAVSSNIIEKLRAKYATSPYAAILDQFVATMESLADDIREEGNRYRAALKVLSKSSGLTVDKLAEAYNSLIGVLDAEAQTFAKMVENQTTHEITQRETLADQISQQIDDLNAEVQGLMNQRDELGIAIVEQKKKLAALQAAFETAQSRLRGEINDQTTKLKIYLPAAVQGPK